jgi:hypothetical protein
MPQVRSFTTVAQGRVSVLINDVRVAEAFDPKLPVTQHPPYKMFKAIWDTGATASVITDKVVAALGLQPIGMTQVHHAQGTTVADVYLVSIALPNQVIFPSVRVTKGIITTGDLLVGMDIIGQGDFAVSNYNGKTVFSYRLPSLEHIDFTGKMISPAQSVQPVPKEGTDNVGKGRNVTDQKAKNARKAARRARMRNR